MSRFSKPATLVPINNRSGSLSYRVTVTIRGKQRKKCFRKLADAELTQQRWEIERIHEAAVRPIITHLTLEEVRQAEAAAELLKTEGVGLLDATKYFLTNKPHVTPAITFAIGLEEFLAEKSLLSAAQCATYRVRGENFKKHVGQGRLISEITARDIHLWLRAKGSHTAPLGKKTWNNYRNDLSTIFAWFLKKPRAWLKENPVDGVIRFPLRSLKSPARQRLDVETCRELMEFLEREKPKWCAFFALTLFLGVRSDLLNGEIRKLAQCVVRDGVELYFQNGYLHLSAEITKEGEPRQTAIPANVAAWFNRYPPNASSICPDRGAAYRAIRERFGIPLNGLRHTAISAYVTRNGSLAGAATEFGCSEGIIRRHYLSRMTPEDAHAFYEIMPIVAVGAQRT